MSTSDTTTDTAVELETWEHAGVTYTTGDPIRYVDHDGTTHAAVFRNVHTADSGELVVSVFDGDRFRFFHADRIAVPKAARTTKTRAPKADVEAHPYARGGEKQRCVVCNLSRNNSVHKTPTV